MEAVLLEKKPFDYGKQEAIFDRVFAAVERVAGEDAFCKFKNDRPIGGLAPAYYEAIVCAFTRQIDKVEVADAARINAAIIAAQQSEQFRQNVGTGANKRSKLNGRIEVMEQAIRNV